MTKYLSVLICFLSLSAIAQNNTSYWQQHVDYNMDIDMDVETFQYKGTQKLEYTNNSPDDLNRVFYHLYFNAFHIYCDFVIFCLKSLILCSIQGPIDKGPCFP